MVIKALKSAGVDVYWEPEDEEVRIQQGGELPSSFSRWTVDSDSSVLSYHDHELRAAHPDSSKNPTFGLEIKSPRFSYDDDEWQESVRKVLRVLHSAFNDRTDNDNYRLYTPHSSGLHVHVGIGTKEARYNFPLSTVRNFLQLGTGFERIIDELHSKDRIDTRGEYCKGLATFFRERASAPRPAIVFEGNFFTSSQDQQQNEDPNVFPPGIVADGLELVDSILSEELGPQRTAMQQLEDGMWRQQKLIILSDHMTSRRTIGFHNAILVEAYLLRAFPKMNPVVDLRNPQTARTYTGENALDVRQEYVAKVAHLLRSITPETPGAPLREIADGPPGSSQSSMAKDPLPSFGSEPVETVPEHSSGSGSDSNAELGPYVVDWVKYLEQNLRAFRDVSSPEGSKCYPDQRAMAYNLQNLVTDQTEVGQKGTIEFRQHRGSIDAQEIIAWIEVAACMVRFAHAKSLAPDSMVAVVEKHAYDPSFDLVSFLRLIKVSDVTIRYYKRWLNTVLIHAKGVWRIEQHEMPNSATAELSRLFAELRQEDKNPIEVMGTIKSKLHNGYYCVPHVEKARLLRMKYAEYELNETHAWKSQGS
ncbi:hypothetical protein GTA08_BOTSDO06565 [Neofusicoccum parvum]|nr:hypothetical protein GTA08_BOTSDO06565 [Neofusicoccum parvum]